MRVLQEYAGASGNGGRHNENSHKNKHDTHCQHPRQRWIRQIVFPSTISPVPDHLRQVTDRDIDHFNYLILVFPVFL